MNPPAFLPLALFAALLGAPLAAAQALISPQPLPEPPNVVYRQVTPDGGVLYSGERKPGARVEKALEVELPPPGSTWSVNGSKRPPAGRLAEPTPVRQVATIPPAGRARTADEAAAEVIRAEMLLEDARRKRDAAHAPLLEELGDTGPDSAYAERQRELARVVAQAEAGLKQARHELAAARRR